MTKNKQSIFHPVHMIRVSSKSTFTN